MRFWGKHKHGEANSRRYWQAAAENSRQFADVVGAFFAAQPYEICAENLYGHDIYRLRLAEKFPRSFARLASRTLNDLQRAFDTAITELEARSGNANKHNRRFPFASCAEELDLILDDPLRSLPDEAKRFIRTSQPYPEGDPVLHALCRLSRGKTRKLLKVGAYTNTRLVHEQRATGMTAAALLNAPTWDEERREVLMLGEDPQGTLSGRVNVQFFVAFRDEPKLEAQSASAVMAHQLSVADELISLLEPTDRSRMPPRRTSKDTGATSEDAAG